MANESELKVAITTTADTSGVVAQTQAFKELEVGASKTADAITVALSKQTVAEKSSTDETRSAQQEAAQSALREIASREKAAKSAKGAADASKALSAELRSLQQAGQSANQVMEGLSRGGIGGLVQSGRGAVSMFRSLAGGALGVPLLAALSAAGVALYALKVIADDATKEIQRGYDKAAAAAKRHTQAIEANKVAAEAALKAQQKDVEKLANEWEDLGTAVDQSHARTEKVNAARSDTDQAKINLQEQQALATAKTPEERAAISRRFDGVRTDQKNKQAAFALDQQESFANDSERAARTKITDAESEFRVAQTKLADKQAARDASTASVADFTVGTDAHTDAVKKAQVDDDALKREKENFEKVVAQMADAIKAAEAKIADAATTRVEVSERRKGLALQTGAEATQRANESRQRLEEAGKPLADIVERRAAATGKLKGLEADKTKSLDLGGNKETIAAIDEAKAELTRLDAEQAEAMKAYAIAQKEASVAQLKQTQAQRADAAKAAQGQLAAQENYHGAVVDNFRAMQEQIDRQAKQIEALNRSRKAVADSKQ